MGPDRIEEGRRRLAGLGESVGGRLGGGVRSLRDHARDLVDGDAAGPPDGPEPAPAPGPDFSALEALDLSDQDHGPSVPIFERMNLSLAGGAPLWELFARVDPGPALPVTAGHTVGLGPLLQRFLDVTDPPALPERAVRRVLDLVSDRYTLTIDPDGLILRGFRQRRHTPWDDVTGITVTNRYESLKSGAIMRIIDNSVQVPIPGLRWLLRAIFGALTRRLERLLLGEDEVRAWRATAGPVVTDIVRRGVDFDLNGPLLIVSLLAKGTTAAVVAEAEARSIPIIDVDPPVGPAPAGAPSSAAALDDTTPAGTPGPPPLPPAPPSAPLRPPAAPTLPSPRSPSPGQPPWSPPAPPAAPQPPHRPGSP